MRGGEGERARSTARMSVEVKALEPGGVRSPGDAVHLPPDRIVCRRRVRRVNLEFLRHGTDAASQRAKQRRVTERGGQDDARHENDVDHGADATEEAGVGSKGRKGVGGWWGRPAQRRLPAPPPLPEVRRGMTSPGFLVGSTAPPSVKPPA